MEMVMIIKMGSGYYFKKTDLCNSDIEDIKNCAVCGEPVTICDSVDTFCDEYDVDISEIKGC